MRSLLRSFAVVALSVAAAVVGVPGTASAAHTTVGYDVSHPQCGTELPKERAFAVIGVNGGIATRPNPCLRDQLRWATKSSGAVASQPRAQLYLNTANPGEFRSFVTTWPASGLTPYGSCDGANSRACSWQYGWERAQHSVTTFFAEAAEEARVETSPARYAWWLDVETMNTWQSGSAEALARNRATLEGMTSYLISRGARVGLYSTHYQWAQIAGTVEDGSILTGRANWLAGATSRSGARANCDEPPLVPAGRVTLTQYVVDDLDHNHSCI
jgi:hypothetical protein